MEHLKTLIRDVPDFPVEGVLFKDITTLLKKPEAFNEVVAHLVERYREWQIDLVAGIESRGFMFAAPLALELNAGFVPIRKAGKLPAETVYREYELEYGTARLEMHTDAVEPGQRVLLLDDVLATGGTAEASAELIEARNGEVVEVAFVIELAFLEGRRRLEPRPVYSMLTY